MTTSPPTTAPTDRSAEVKAAHRNGAQHVAAEFVAVAWYTGVWFWGIALFLVGLLTLIDAQGWADLDVAEILTSSMGSPKIFLFVMAIIAPLLMIAVYLAAGVTRRTFTHGLWFGAVATGATFALAVAAIHLAVWWWRDRAGETVAIEGQPYADGSEFVTILAVEAVLCTAYILAGILIGLGYYRFGFIGGTAMVVVVIALLVAVEAVTRAGFIGANTARGIGIDGTPLALAILGGALITVVMAWALRLTLRSVAVRPVDFEMG